MTPSVRFREAHRGDAAAIERLLVENGLPAAAVQSPTAEFIVGIQREGVIAVGGIERHADDGILRSLVVRADVRRTGVGSAMCEVLEDRAADAGITTLYLLTTTAEGFFSTRGYRRTDRDGVPAAVAESTLFAEQCPVGAACLRKSLASINP